MTGNVVTEGDSLIVTEGSSLAVYSDRPKMLRRQNLRAVLILLPAAAALFWLFGPVRGLIIAAFYSVLYAAGLVAILQARLPIVTISPDGLTIHTVLTQVGLLRWDEIAEVRPYTMIYRYVGIVPRDPDALYRRLGARGNFLRLNGWCVPLYRAFGVFIAPINIPQEYLPITADDLAARIVAARPAVSVTGVWPPAPKAVSAEDSPNG